MPLALALILTPLAACQQREVAYTTFTPLPRLEAGPPRSYQLGFSTLPAHLTDTAYQETFDLSANFGELLLVQRPPSWASFLPGNVPSAETHQTTITERRAISDRGLSLLLALDPFDPSDRGRLSGLPITFEGEDFTNIALRHAFVAEARYIALNYQPAYLSLGTEVNSTFERNPASYEAFIDTYLEAYDVVKAVSPDTLVFVSFQYEQLLGLIPWEPPHVPRWELAEAFQGKLDLFAITTYPSFAFPIARKIPSAHYLQIREHTSLPIAIVSAGYASTPGREGLNSSTPSEQRRFLKRLFRDADILGVSTVVWFASRDPAFVMTPPFDLFSSIGLRTADDLPKEAWAIWEDTARRPYKSVTRPSLPPP